MQHRIDALILMSSSRSHAVSLQKEAKIHLRSMTSLLNLILDGNGVLNPDSDYPPRFHMLAKSSQT